jgi:hypothetical protein
MPTPYNTGGPELSSDAARWVKAEVDNPIDQLSVFEIKSQLREKHFLIERVSAEIAIGRANHGRENNYDGQAYPSPEAEEAAFDDHGAHIGALAVSWYQVLSKELVHPNSDEWTDEILTLDEVREAMASDEERINRSQADLPGEVVNG